MEWINVKDRLPENNVWVLVAIENVGVLTELGIYCCDCENGTGKLSTGWLTSCSLHKEERITHWMPLPEPPKK